MCFECILRQVSSEVLNRLRAEMFKSFNLEDEAQQTGQNAAPSVDKSEAESALEGMGIFGATDAYRVIQQLRAEKENQRCSIINYQNRADDIHLRNADLSNENNALRANNHRLIEQLEYSANSYHEENVRLIRLHNEMAAANKCYHQENETLRQNYSDALNEIERKNEAVIALQAANDSFHNELNKMTAQRNEAYTDVIARNKMIVNLASMIPDIK